MSDELDEEPDECDCCRFPDPLGGLTESRRTMPGGESAPYRLCKLCYETMVGSWHEFDRQHDLETMEILRTQCYIGNQLRLDIAAVTPSPPT